jgi:hypothetical protein
MDKTYEDYTDKLENIIRNIKINNKKYKQNSIKLNKSEESKGEEIKGEESKNEESKDEESKSEESKNEESKNEESKSEESKSEESKSEKDFYCKQLDSLNYCLEMHKVRKNKQADFDIHSTLKYNIEDENIGKNIIFNNWKDIDDNLKKNLLEEFIKETSENNNLNLEYTKIFVNNNLNKIKYDKYNKKIVDIHGMIKGIYNNESILKIKIKDKKNTHINKLRKSLINIKKNNIK